MPVKEIRKSPACGLLRMCFACVNPLCQPCRGRLISHQRRQLPLKGKPGERRRRKISPPRRSALKSPSGRSQHQRGSPSASRARAMHPPCIVRRATMPHKHGAQPSKDPCTNTQERESKGSNDPLAGSRGRAPCILLSCGCRGGGDGCRGSPRSGGAPRSGRCTRCRCGSGSRGPERRSR